MSKLEDRYFKFRWKKVGEHWHGSIYSAKSPSQTYAKLGSLRMDESDMLVFRHFFRASDFNGPFAGHMWEVEP